MSDLQRMMVQGGLAGAEYLDDRTLRERISERRKQLEAELDRIKVVENTLQEHPEIAQVIDLLRGIQI